MDINSLHKFYEHAVLPQFGIPTDSIQWTSDKNIGYDEDAYYFKAKKESSVENYCLLFRDFGDFSDIEIKRSIRIPNNRFTLIRPKYHPNLKSLKFGNIPTGGKSAEGVIGYFTLIKIN